MKKALLTGSSGFIGSNVREMLSERFILFAPNRYELNLMDENNVKKYLNNHKFDVVFHCANPNPTKNALDDISKMSEDSIRAFLNLYNERDKFEKMVYIGSGAEYDKTLEISNVKEEECFRSIPKDSYGFAKYIMNMISDKSENIYNLRLFGCYGPGDHESKFITHCIRSILNNEAITIRQDCKFDYIHVYDLARIMIWIGENNPQYHAYNVSGNNHAFLSEIAKEVCSQMKSELGIKILSEGYNREYTCDGRRFWTESLIDNPMSLKEGISLQIEWEKANLK